MRVMRYQFAKYQAAGCIVDARSRRVLDVEVLVVSDPELIQGVTEPDEAKTTLVGV